MKLIMQYFSLWIGEGITSELVVVSRRHRDTLTLSQYRNSPGIKEDSLNEQPLPWEP
jgi:hypothetical protein